MKCWFTKCLYPESEDLPPDYSTIAIENNKYEKIDIFNDKPAEAFDIKQFNISEIKDNSVVVAVGRRDSGKTRLIKDILFSKHQRLKEGLVISPVYSDFENFIPKEIVYENPAIINCFLRERGNASVKKEKIPYSFLILDSLNFPKESNSTIQETFFNGRHYNLLSLVEIQHPNELSPCLRACIDYTFIFKPTCKKYIKLLYEKYASVLSQDLFDKILSEMPADHCLVINNNTRSSKIQDTIFYYKPQDHPGFYFKK